MFIAGAGPISPPVTTASASASVERDVLRGVIAQQQVLIQTLSSSLSEMRSVADSLRVALSSLRESAMALQSTAQTLPVQIIEQNKSMMEQMLQRLVEDRLCLIAKSTPSPSQPVEAPGSVTAPMMSDTQIESDKLKMTSSSSPLPEPLAAVTSDGSSAMTVLPSTASSSNTLSSPSQSQAAQSATVTVGAEVGSPATAAVDVASARTAGDLSASYVDLSLPVHHVGTNSATGVDDAQLLSAADGSAVLDRKEQKPADEEADLVMLQSSIAMEPSAQTVAQLDELERLGYSNRVFNQVLLHQNQNDLTKVIASLRHYYRVPLMPPPDLT